MNYTTLTATLKDMLENQEATFASYTDQFIKLGERRIHMMFELPSAMKHQTGTATSGDEFYSLPTDTVAVLDVAVISDGDYTHLKKVEHAFIREVYPDPSENNALPEFYSIYDHDTIKLGPTPDSNYSMEVTYHGVPTSIVDASTTWLGDNFDRALLYAALAEGYTFMKGDPDMLAHYEKAFQEEAVKMNQLVAKKQHSDDLFDSMFSRARSK